MSSRRGGLSPERNSIMDFKEVSSMTRRQEASQRGDKGGLGYNIFEPGSNENFQFLNRWREQYAEGVLNRD